MTTFSPLQLKGHAFPIVNIRANPDGSRDGKLGINQSLSFLPVPETPNQWQLELRISFGSAEATKFLYEAEIHVVGVVEIGGEMESERKEQIAAVNGLSLLYGAVREMILNITARSIHGPWCIPSLNFTEVLKLAQQRPLPAPANP